jgi:hydroxymethylpyrimidine/phosphomethylpyrimidine kinase
VYGFAISTANTIQTENEFVAIQWTDLDFVLQSVETIFGSYDIKAVKIGIVPSLEYLKEIIATIKKVSPKTKIVWDTVLKSTTDYNFLTLGNQTTLIEILEEIALITPNYNEILQFTSKGFNAETTAILLSKHCPVLLKGGHNPDEIGSDYLYLENEYFNLEPNSTTIFDKHGSGCVLSSAITAHLALGQELKTACASAKKYIEAYLQSNPTKLGYHYVP